jgi:hypothetical protein
MNQERLIDQFDRRNSIYYLDEYMGDFFFVKSQIFHFFVFDKTSYDLSNGQTLLDYTNSTDKLLGIIFLDIFGLTLNAKIIFD